jgi:hypothetical protein
VRTAAPRLFKFRRFSRAIYAVGLLFCTVMLGLDVQLFLEGSYALASAAAAFLAWFTVLTWRECYRVWSYRIDLGPSWIRCSVFGKDVILTFADLSVYMEAPMRFEGERFGGYQFVLEDVHGQMIHFSTQIVGWAALHEALHAVRPELIPRPADTSARSRLGIWKVPMSVGAGAFTAAGQDIPEEWNHPTRERWYDAVIGYSLGLGLALLIGHFVIRPLGQVFKEWEVPYLLWFLPSIMLAVGLAAAVTQLYVMNTRRRRMARARID